MGSIKIEFAVQMHGEKCAERVREALQDVGDVQINLAEGRVVIQTLEPWPILQDKIEKTGRKAVLSGFGGQSAVAVINATGSVIDRTPIQGVVRFSAITADKAGAVVDGVVDGLSEGLHGMHIHESGDISNGCHSVGEHYNPHGSPHGAPEDEPTKRHIGDLGNIRASSEGRASFRFVDPLLEVWDIIGRSVVIKEREDDLGRTENPESRINGNSGARIACGIIARSAGILQNFKKICACDGVTIWDERTKPTTNGNQQTNKL